MSVDPVAPVPDRLVEHLAGRLSFGPALGAGSTGTVYQARVESEFAGLEVGAEVAVKVLHRDRAGDPAAVAQLRREAQLGASLDDPHVVRVRTIGEVPGDLDEPTPLVYLVSDLVHGRTLRQVIAADGPAIGDLARRIGEQAARGLAAVHAAGVVHRDLKPENVLITDAAEVQIMDLGLARPRGEASFGSSGGFHGTVGYAAPEILRGAPATPASDLYALGLVLFELLTGQHAFADATDADAMIHRHLHANPPRPSHHQPWVSRFLDEVVAGLLQKAPEQRFGSALEVAEILAGGEGSAWWHERERSAPVLASRRRLDRMRRSRPTALVDRRDERAQLDEVLQSAVDGRGAAVLVTGHPGSGRRRLLDEWIEQWLDDSGDRVVFLGGVAANEPTVPSGEPFRSIVREALLPGEDEDAPRIRERLARRAEEQLRFDPADAARLAEVLTGPGDTLRLADRRELLHRALRALADRQHALVLRVDRAEHLGNTARQVVERLVDECAGLPIVLLLVSDRGWPGGKFPGRELRIGGLDRDAFAAFGLLLFRHGEAPIAMLTRAHRSLSGMPGALFASLDDLVQRGKLEGRPGDFHQLAAEIDGIAPARPALQRLRERIEGLPPQRRHVVQTAAVLGDRFQVDDVAALTGRPEIEVLEALGAFDNLVVRVDGGHGVFRHRDYRLATLAAIPVGIRRSLHRAAAWRLEDRGAPRLDVGMHLSRATEHEACIEPLLDGLDVLIRSGSRQSTQRVIERLRLHLDAVADQERFAPGRLRWLLASGTAWAAQNRSKEAGDAYRAAVPLALALDRPADRARALVGLAESAQLAGRLVTAVQLLADAEEIVRELNAPGDETAARVRLVHARVMAYGGQALEALRLTSDALRVAPPSARALRGHLHVDLARWQALRLRFLRALRSLDLAGELAAELGDSAIGLRVRLHRGRTFSILGDADAATDELGAAVQAAIGLGDDRLHGRALWFGAEMSALAGDAARAAPMLREARRVARTAADVVTVGVASSLLYLLGEDELGAVPDDAWSIPMVHLMLSLAIGVRARRAGDVDRAAEILADAANIERRVRVQLPLRVALHRAAGNDRIADRLVRAVSGRLPAGSMRRRFQLAIDRLQFPTVDPV